jgi:hypothetical protein
MCRTDATTTRRNPFLWFRGTFEADDCNQHNVQLTQLEKDLREAETTPALAWIASDAQHGSADADRILERVFPQIQNSLAYADGGLIVIVGDVGDAATAGAGTPVGALLVSSFTPAGSVDATPANAFSLLRTLQQFYGVDPLGYAAADGVRPLPDRLFSVTPEPARDD